MRTGSTVHLAALCLGAVTRVARDAPGALTQRDYDAEKILTTPWNALYLFKQDKGAKICSSEQSWNLDI